MSDARWALYGLDSRCHDCAGTGRECGDPAECGCWREPRRCPVSRVCSTCDGSGRLSPDDTYEAAVEASASLDAAIGGVL